jgi:lysophospholipase L1-like esterase
LSISHVLPLVISLGAVACSSDATGPQGGNGGQGSGGVSSTGGTTASGGSGSGGVSSTGGTTASGGSGSGGAAGGTQTGAGGGPATGGTLGTGGSSATGGTSAATGGTKGTGGATGKGGTTGTPGGAGGTAAGGAGATGQGGTGPGTGGRTTGDGGPGRDGGAPGSGGRTGGSGGQTGGTGGRSNPDASPSTGGTGGGTGYNPCKASPCVILPLGDSITHGFGSSDDAGYRSQLFKLVVAANQNVTFIGSLSNGPSTVSGKTFPKNHEGHDGITVSGIASYVPPTKAFSTTPHIVLVHLGTNDMTSNHDPTTTANQLDTLVTNLVKAAPDALIAVAKNIPLGYSNSNWTSYNSKIPGVVQTHADKGEHVIVVEMSTLPTSDIKGNGDVHPTDKGYADMANIWYDAIKGSLPN